MRIIVLKKDEFTSKTGTEFVKCSYLDEKGNVGEIFTTKENFSSFGYDQAKILTNTDLSEIFKTFRMSEVDFDSKGRVFGLQ